MPPSIEARMLDRLYIAKPEPGTCSGCGAEVEPIQSLGGRWLLPELCGISWPGPGWAKVGCQGVSDFEEWAIEIAELEYEQKLTGAGLPATKLKLRAKMEHDPPSQLLHFKKPCVANTSVPWGVCLIGATGTGKTSALVSTLRHYLFDASTPWRARYVTEAQLVESLKPGGGRDLEFWTSFELLIVDEVGRDVTNWAIGRMNEVVDARNDSGLPLVLASNFGPKGLEEIYGQRLTDRLLEMALLSKENAYLALSYSWRHRDKQGRPQQRPVPE